MKRKATNFNFLLLQNERFKTLWKKVWSTNTYFICKGPSHTEVFPCLCNWQLVIFEGWIVRLINLCLLISKQILNLECRSILIDLRKLCLYSWMKLKNKGLNWNLLRAIGNPIKQFNLKNTRLVLNSSAARYFNYDLDETKLCKTELTFIG